MTKMDCFETFSFVGPISPNCVGCADKEDCKRRAYLEMGNMQGINPTTPADACPSEAKKFDEGKARLSLLYPTMFNMILAKDGQDWYYSTCCRLIAVGHITSRGELTDRIREVVWHIRSKLGTFETLKQASDAMAYGIKKYGRNNWKAGMAWSRLLDAALRHFVAASLGEDIDEESGLPHTALGLASLHMLLGNVVLGVGENDLFEE